MALIFPRNNFGLSYFQFEFMKEYFHVWSITKHLNANSQTWPRLIFVTKIQFEYRNKSTEMVRKR